MKRPKAATTAHVASLSVDAAGRLPAPKTVPAAVKRAWRRIANALPAGRIRIEESALFESYCRHIVRAERLEQILDKLDPAADAAKFARLAELCALESRLLLALARALRFSTQTRSRADSAEIARAGHDNVIDMAAAADRVVAAAKARREGNDRTE